jgi:hypothetical protein
MRVILPILMTLFLCAGLHRDVESRGADQSGASAGLADVQKAMGGARALAGVRTLTVRLIRQSRMVSGSRNAKPIIEFAEDEMKVRILRPDHVLFEMTPITFKASPQVVGFAKGQVIGTGRRWRDKQDYGYLLFALLLQSDPVFPFVFRGSEGDVLKFQDPNGVEVRVQLDPATRLPQRLTYDRLETTNDGTPTGKRQPTREELSGFHTVANIKIPSMIKTYEGDRLMLERRIEDVKVNPPLTSADFKR